MGTREVLAGYNKKVSPEKDNKDSQVQTLRERERERERKQRVLKFRGSCGG
jgi:hypothetical protein